MSKKDNGELVKDLRRQGFTVELTNGNHWKVSHPERRGIAFMSFTPGDHRSIKNAMRELRKIGYCNQPEHRSKKKRDKKK